MSERLNIAFAGLTAAGKTTHAKLLAEQLGYEYVSATELFLEMMNIDESPDRIWFTHYDMLELTRDVTDVDERLDRHLSYLAQTQTGVVFDTWAIAWTSDTPIVRLWIESDLDSRARKCYVSQGDEKELSVEAAKAHINKKDTATRQKFLRWHGFDLFRDHGIFDAIINNTDLIPEPTLAVSEQGIATFEPVVRSVVDYRLAIMDGLPQSEAVDLAISLQEQYGDHITLLR